MKKHRVRNFIIAAIICTPLVLLALSYGKYKFNNVEDSCSQELEKYVQDISAQDGSIFLDSYLEFNCDGFYIIGPYDTSKYKHEVVGETWYHYSSYLSYLFNEILFQGDTTDEIFQQLAFVKNEKVISVATIYRKEGDFTNLEKKYYSISQLFSNVSSDDKKWNYIIENFDG